MAVTLKDIALAMGVTPTTVHKALRGKEGVSEELRAAIQQKAAQMGYRPNYMAASLKRRDVRFAVVIPEASLDNKYYYGNLWKGVRTFLQETDRFNISVLEAPYLPAPGANGAVLRELYEAHAEDLDGILTIAIEQDDEASFFLHKFAQKGVSVVLLGSDLYPDARFCCVKTYDEMAGSLAAELLTGFALSPEPQKIILTGDYGPLGKQDQYFNAQGFRQYLAQAAPHYEVLSIHGPDAEEVQQKICATLRQNPDIFAIYSCNARYTVRMADAVAALGLQGRVRLIGNDCFEESIALLRNGQLRAIIDKKIARQSYLGMRVLFDYLMKSEYPPQDTIYVHPEVVLRSNVDMDRSPKI